MLKMDNREKLVYVEPAWKYPLSVQDLVLHPPEGYRFITPKGRSERLFRSLAKYDVSYKLQAFMGIFIPIQLLKSYFNKLKSSPKDSVLTYSLTHLVLRKEPWILDMENELPYLLVWNEKHLKKYKDKIMEVLNSNYCRKIICRVNKGKEALLATFGKELEEKIEVVYWGTIPKNFKKEYNKDTVKILFVNSGNINTALHFYAKGGAEVVEAFKALSQKYDNIELVIRSGLPQNLKRKITKLSRVKVIDKPISWTELEKEWLSADIFVLPNHINTPAQVFYDAMSYGLPIVTTDTWANSELIENGKTGFLVHNPRSAHFQEGPILHLTHTEFFNEIMKGHEPKVVKGLIKAISTLIENQELRRKMGEAARQEIEHGKFSLKKRNDKLKEILDEAISNEFS
jgi:glycosyltransferase involved in cell wall biosynthesis